MNIYLDVEALEKIGEIIAEKQTIEKDRIKKSRRSKPKRPKVKKLKGEFRTVRDLELSKEIALKIFKKSMEYVPVDTGALKSSGRLIYERGKWVIIYSRPYAIYVHEILGNIHKEPTRAKFLEDAAYEVNNSISVKGLSVIFSMKMDTTEVRLTINKVQEKDKGRGL